MRKKAIDEHYCPYCAEEGKRIRLGRLNKNKGWEHWFCKECFTEYMYKKTTGEWRKMITSVNGNVILKRKITKKETENLLWI